MVHVTDKLTARLLLSHTSACNGSWHGEVNGVDYCFAIFGMCNGSWHG